MVSAREVLENGVDFVFPKCVALINECNKTAFTLGLVRQLQDTRPVHVRVGSGHLGQAFVYEHKVNVEKRQAVLLRSAWLKLADDGMDGARPLTIKVLVDDKVVLDQPIDHHIRKGYPFPRRPCSCNAWEMDLDCKCRETPLLVPGRLSMALFGAAKCDDAVVGEGVGEAYPTMPYGIFLPVDSVVQIAVVKPGSGEVDFKATCGITAALYSTSTKDIP